MSVLVVDPLTCDALIEQRRLTGGDRYDEVWDGLYVANPLGSVEHQRMVMELCLAFGRVVDDAGLGTVLPGANVASFEENWKNDFRCPDVVVVLTGGRARDIGAAWIGGPDFLVEIRSPGEKATDKLPFYERVGVRELLVVDRDTKDAELFRLQDGKLISVGTSSNAGRAVLLSEVLPLSFARGSDADRPQLIVHRTDGRESSWRV